MLDLLRELWRLLLCPEQFAKYCGGEGLPEAT